MNLIEIRNKIEGAWSKDTSYKPDEWTKENPAWGQCAVTTKLLFDMFGGNVVMGYFHHNKETRRHYFNQVNGFTIDFTVVQFDLLDSFTLIATGNTNPDNLITDDWMLKRFHLFKINFLLLNN